MLEGMVGGWCCRMNGETLVQDGTPRARDMKLRESRNYKGILKAS
jgi:hypothetical protein